MKTGWKNNNNRAFSLAQITCFDVLTRPIQAVAKNAIHLGAMTLTFMASAPVNATNARRKGRRAPARLTSNCNENVSLIRPIQGRCGRYTVNPGLPFCIFQFSAFDYSGMCIYVQFICLLFKLFYINYPLNAKYDRVVAPIEILWDKQRYSLPDQWGVRPKGRWKVTKRCIFHAAHAACPPKGDGSVTLHVCALITGFQLALSASKKLKQVPHLPHV
jgi:hypothetical protein